MSRTLDVCLGDDGRLVGQLHYNRSGARESSAFEYDSGWLGAGDNFSIDPSLPLVRGPQFRKAQQGGSVFPGAIADSEPDGWGRRVILRDHAKRRAEAQDGANAGVPGILSALDFLLAVDDVSRIGALRFREKDGSFLGTGQEGGRRTPPLLELQAMLSATRAVELDTATATELAYLRGMATSLGGLRPKCTIVDEDGRLCVGKFPSVGDTRPVTVAEVLALQLARAAGIRAAEARVVLSEGVAVALIRRFDRAPGGRRGYLSAASMLGAEITDPGEHAYTEIVDAIRKSGADIRRDIPELWRRMAFTVLITNVDDHLRNHGFLYATGGLWDLSPAFDINPFPDRARELKTWISEETGPAATVDALLSVAPYFGLKLSQAKQILSEVESAVATWRSVGAGLGMTSVELDQFAQAFEHEEREAARRAMALSTPGG